MTAKRINPYERLRRQFGEYCNSIEYAPRRRMWIYPKEKLSSSWRLDDLAERVAAADQLGYDVMLTNTDEGLVVYYSKRPDKRPWNV